MESDERLIFTLVKGLCVSHGAKDDVSVQELRLKHSPFSSPPRYPAVQMTESVLSCRRPKSLRPALQRQTRTRRFFWQITVWTIHPARVSRSHTPGFACKTRLAPIEYMKVATKCDYSQLQEKTEASGKSKTTKAIGRLGLKESHPHLRAAKCPSPKH
jgi:hypothetical protein